MPRFIVAQYERPNGEVVSRVIDLLEGKVLLFAYTFELAERFCGSLNTEVVKVDD